jgi:hypothetical protein
MFLTGGALAAVNMQAMARRSAAVSVSLAVASVVLALANRVRA